MSNSQLRDYVEALIRIFKMYLIQVWGTSKNHVASHNTSYKLDEVEKLMKDGLVKVTSDDWKSYENHVIKIEEDMWEKEALVDLFHQGYTPMVIQPYEDREDESDSDSDSEDDEI
jgi:hypothetical protein